MPNNRQITLDGFLRAFQNQDQQQPDKPFCFILGAGASVTSGIRTGGALAMNFLEDINRAENLEGLPLEKWATDVQLGVEGFSLERVEEFYPQLYERLFGEHSDRGYAFLEKEMEDKLRDYFDAGVQLVWYVTPSSREVKVHTAPDNLTLLNEKQTLDGGDVLPGFQLELGELFAEPRREESK